MTRRWLGVGHHSWYVASRPPKERRFSLAQRRCAEYEPTTTRAAWRARTASSSGAPPPPRQRASARVRCASSGAGMALEAAAGTSHHGRAPRKRGLSPTLYFCCCACGDHNQRGTARTHRNLECCASSPKTAGDGARVRRVTSGAGLALETAAGTSHHGQALMENGLSPARCPSTGHRPTIISTVLRAHVASSSAASPSLR